MADDLAARTLIRQMREQYDAQINWLTSRLTVFLALQGSTVAYDVPLATFRAGNYSSFVAVALLADADGEPGVFVKIAGSAADDGRNNIKDSVGTLFTRRSYR